VAVPRSSPRANAQQKQVFDPALRSAAVPWRLEFGWRSAKVSSFWVAQRFSAAIGNLYL
jgi:hypothetical protein